MKVIGKTSTNYFKFESLENVRLWEYVITKNTDNKEVLGIVKNVTAENGKYICEAKVIGVLSDNKILMNRYPIKPDENVKFCEDTILNNIFYVKNGISIGHLLTRENVRVYLDTNSLVSRHFAILSVTGGGKSNTVSVLCRELGKKNASIIIFDTHGEYTTLYHEDLEGKVKVIVPKMNPSMLSPDELSDLIGIDKNDFEKRIYLEYAYYTIKNDFPNIEGLEFIEKLENLLYEWSKSAEVGWDIKYYNPLMRKYERRKVGEQDFINIISLYNIVGKFMIDFSLYIGDRDIIEEFDIGKINVVNLSGLEIHQMRTIVGYIAKHILSKRTLYLKSLKERNIPNERIRMTALSNLEIIDKHYKIVKKPVLIILEEAHVFIPINEKTESSLWLGKIAKEGRKFGVGLGLISQRPKELDPNILSQTNTKIILRIIEPEDQKYIQRASEELGEDLAKDLASLCIGEALIVGTAINLPSVVKIDKFDGIYGGKDIDIVGEWMNISDEW
ncbi:putative DNA double-strand break repair helicase HerA [Methanocaldococcus lauensis]|uniref:Putative DNA double-strand break repair helicase HerA n=1 Tax=Methanocaldococcus lauensis TaxID=2546128 RepID=A0A8D6PUI6_9EURY|nr:ATP-binding protein [Methanocaldococcus lauensis]CAB3288265.1 putative DNA double-strand break repair helicase HerA [Methanocaldococcus lauensis]